MQIEIKKAKIVSSYNLTYNYTQKEDNFENEISTKSDAPIHNDLRNAFRKLTPHLAYICELITKDKAEKLINLMEIDYSLDDTQENYNDELAEFFKKYQTDGFEVSGRDDKEGVKIFGVKLLDTMKSIALTTPKQIYNDDYPFGDELAEVVEDCRNEVFEYFKGKQAPNQQTEMDFEFADEEDVIQTHSYDS